MSNVIFSIIVTDIKYIKIIIKYVNILLKQKLVNVIHIWNYINKNNKDNEELFNLCQTNIKYVLFEPPLPDIKKGYYYQYYSKYIEDDAILIKCDDRIVYLDLKNFKNFVNVIKEYGLYIPNIINNDVCAYFQQEEGCHKLFNYNVNKTELNKIINSIGNFNILSDWYKEYDKADKIHKNFLKNKNKFIFQNENKIIEYGNHIHLNIFGILGKYAKEMFKEITPFIVFNDNSYFGLAPLHNNKKHKIFVGFICSYLSFDEQDIHKLEEKYLSKYESLLTYEYNILNSKHNE